MFFVLFERFQNLITIVCMPVGIMHLGGFFPIFVGGDAVVAYVTGIPILTSLVVSIRCIHTGRITLNKTINVKNKQ